MDGALGCLRASLSLSHGSRRSVYKTKGRNLPVGLSVESADPHVIAGIWVVGSEVRITTGS